MRALGPAARSTGAVTTCALAAAVAVVLAVATADAAVFVVNTTSDTTDGVCGSGPGECTLREALAAAGSTAGSDSIRFDPSVVRLGNPGVIDIVSVLPVVADGAGTFVDGAGAGVIIEQPQDGLGVALDALVFASASGVPLANVRVANLTIRDFTGRGIVICGGDPATCADDVKAAVVQNVVVTGSGESGIQVDGRAVSKLRLVDVVASSNGGSGIRLSGTQSLLGTRIQRATVRNSGGAGIRLSGDVVVDTAIADSIAAYNGGAGITFEVFVRLAKTKITAAAAIGNTQRGIDLQASSSVATTSIARAIASANGEVGISISGGDIATTTIKDVAAIRNSFGIVLSAGATITGAKITTTKAAGNTNDGIVLGGDENVTGSKLTNLVVVGNGTNGLRFEGSHNVAQRVRASGNHGDGIRLDFTNGGGGNTISKSTAHANDGHGIHIQLGNTGNVVQQNVSLAQDGDDLVDDNPACDANLWKKNVFETRNDPCIH
jgi:CSLREA domain-containing protein